VTRALSLPIECYTWQQICHVSDLLNIWSYPVTMLSPLKSEPSHECLVIRYHNLWVLMNL